VNHFLAALSLSLLVAMVAAMLMLAGLESHVAAHEFFFSPRTTESFTRVAPILGVFLLGAVGLWVAMLRHYLQNRAAMSRRWLFWLVASNWGAAIVYFFVVWRPRAKHEST
jgi:hypothetical protein